MATTVAAVDARRSFGRLLNIVSLKGEEIIIERAGRKIAKLSPIDAPSPASRRVGSGKLDFRKAKGLGVKYWRGVDVPSYLEKERAEWD